MFSLKNFPFTETLNQGNIFFQSPLHSFQFVLKSVQTLLFSVDFFKLKRGLVLLALCLFSFQSFSHGPGYSEKEIETALRIFEKTIMLSPEFFDRSEEDRLSLPYYKVNGYRIYLDEGFWDLTRIWLKLYTEELNKHCPCNLDPELLLKEAKNYVPENLLLKRGNQVGEKAVSLAVEWATLHGYFAAVTILIWELAIEPVIVGPFHVLCNVASFAVAGLSRKTARTYRAFSYGMKLGGGGALLTPVKMAWLLHKLKKSRDRVFFHVEQALIFREEEARRQGKKNPYAHRLLWIEELKQKINPLLQDIDQYEEQMQQEGLSARRQRSLQRKIRKAREEIERTTQVHRKIFLECDTKELF